MSGSAEIGAGKRRLQMTFSRGNNATVCISFDGAIIVVPAEKWAEIMADVSSRGVTPETVTEALRLHHGGAIPDQQGSTEGEPGGPLAVASAEQAPRKPPFEIAELQSIANRAGAHAATLRLGSTWRHAFENLGHFAEYVLGLVLRAHITAKAAQRREEKP